MTYTRKTNLTKRKIKNALITLMKTMHFEHITINQIAELAEVTRSTFYRYYDDKYELIEEIEDDVITRMAELRKEFKLKGDGTEIYQKAIIAKMFVALEPYAETIHLLLETATNFEMKLKEDMASRFEIVHQLSDLSNVEKDLLREYVFNMFITTLKYWAAHLDTISANEVANIIVKVQWNGFKQLMENSMKQNK